MVWGSKAIKKKKNQRLTKKSLVRLEEERDEGKGDGGKSSGGTRDWKKRPPTNNG